MLGVGTFNIPAGVARRGHGHASPHLVLVSGGDFEEAADGKVRELGARAVRLSRANATHDLVFGENGARCLMIESKGPFWRRLFDRALNGREHVFGLAAHEQIAALTDLNSAEDLARSSKRALAFGQLLAVLERGEHRAPAWLDDAVWALDRGADASIGGIARSLQRDRVHFTRAFASYMGMRPSEYRALRRVGAAVVALRERSDKLSDIALAYGFAHQSHMTNDFRAVLGVTPGRLRSGAA